MTTKQKTAATSIKEYDGLIKKMTETIDQQREALIGHEERLDEITKSLMYVSKIIDSLMLVNKATRIIMRDLSERVGLTNEALEELNKLPLDDDEEEEEKKEEEEDEGEKEEEDK